MPLLTKGRFVKQAKLSRLGPIVRFINRLDALEGQGRSRELDGTAIAIRIILYLPSQTNSVFIRERGWGFFSPPRGRTGNSEIARKFREIPGRSTSDSREWTFPGCGR